MSWTKQYQAYFSKTFNGITATFFKDLDLGQILQVQSDDEGVIADGGRPDAVSIRNTLTTQLTCGVSQYQHLDNAPKPFCAFPLYGLQEDVMVPIEKVLLMFSTTPINTGDPIEQAHNPAILQAYSPSILIDLTDATMRNVNYDINNGWSWGGNSWARQISVDQDLVPLLVES